MLSYSSDSSFDGAIADLNFLVLYVLGWQLIQSTQLYSPESYIASVLVMEAGVPEVTICDLSFPHPSVLLVTLNKPERLNCLPILGHKELENVWRWMDLNPNITVGIITGSGRAFCGGADLRGQSHISYS